MKSILNLIKNSMTIIILLYSLITIMLVCTAFVAGKDIGYSKGIAAGTSAEYVNGVGDGLKTCLETMLRKAVDQRHDLLPQNEEEVL